jgi:excisionase family DNA binding protein
MKAPQDEALLTPAEVAALFRVDPKTVTRWAKAGKLSSIRTLGGHRRYRADEVRRFLDGARGQANGAGE